MTRDEAKELLQLYRPGGQDARDPFFAEALEMAENDPVLREWLVTQQAFDGVISRAVRQIEIPRELPKRLVPPQAVRWWNRSLRPVEFAAAALFVFFVAVGGFWVRAQQSAFSPLRARLLQQSWAGNRHVDLETTNLLEIRRFIAASEIPADFNLPPELSAMHVHGCKLLPAKGQKVPCICFVDGSKHLHLLVVNGDRFPAEPDFDSPDFEQWNNWTTATWTQGTTTFVLSGLKPIEFVKKFRREGQWNWGG